MPLLVICGRPASGKTTLSQRISDFLTQHGQEDMNVCVVSDYSTKSTFSRNVFNNFKEEKEARSAIRSAVQKLLKKNVVVICDSLNYVKGFRYELFCLAKNAQTTYAVLFCNASREICKTLNQTLDESVRYPDEIFEQLLFRFEEPDSKNRWDSPLLEVKMGGKPPNFLSSRVSETNESAIDNEVCSSSNEHSFVINDVASEEAISSSNLSSSHLPLNISLPFEELYNIIIKGKNMMANMCTKSLTPKNSSMLSYDFDQCTQNIIRNYLVQQKTALCCGEKFVVFSGELGANNLMEFKKHRSLSDLQRLKQQFISYVKLHPTNNIDQISVMFVNFLNNS